MTLIVILTQIIVLLFYNSCNRLSQATWHIVFCISHTKPDSFSTLFQAFDSFVCNNRCLLILPHASLIPHYRRQFFSPQLKSGRCWLSFGFQGLPFQFQPSPCLFSTLPPLLRSAGIGEEPRQENQRGPSDLTDRSLADVCSFVDIFQQAHWASTAHPHLTSLKPSYSEEYADLTFIHLYRIFIYRSL